MTKLLIVSGLQIHPPGSGGQLRSSGLAAALAERGVDIEIYSLVGRKADYLAGAPSGWMQVAPRIREFVDRTRWWAAVQMAFYRLHLPPLWITWLLRLFRPKLLRQLLTTCDWVVIDFPFLYPAARGSTKPVLLNTHNVEANLATGLSRHFVAAIEAEAARRANLIVCCSTEDQAHFDAVNGPGRTLVVANGVDTQRFAQLAAKRQESRDALQLGPDTTVLLFAASNFGPNAEGLAFLSDFAAKHEGLLKQRQIHFLVAGSVSKSAYQTPHLTVTGPVAAIEPYFAAADWAINAVFRGSGTNVKMGEYMAADLPILSTAVGQRGFDFQSGIHGLTFTPDTLAGLLADHPALQDRSAAAFLAASAKTANMARISMQAATEPLARRLLGGHSSLLL